MEKKYKIVCESKEMRVKMTESQCKREREIEREREREREERKREGERDRRERDLPAYSNSCIHLKMHWSSCMDRNGYTVHKIVY